MSRAITNKEMQVHVECTCGYNEVYWQSAHIRYKSFSAIGIKRKHDKKTGAHFLLWHQKTESCYHCNSE